MFLTNSGDTYSEATTSEIISGLSLLKSLPSRASDTVQFDKQVYLMALDGVTKYGFATAIKGVLQGKLGHGFFPSAPELRMKCDEAMKPIIDAVARASRERKEREEAAAFRPVHHTDAEKARVSQIYQQFCEGYKSRAEPVSIADIAARYDRAVLDQVPDAPKQFHRAGSMF
jgi:hypothetical protein